MHKILSELYKITSNEVMKFFREYEYKFFISRLKIFREYEHKLFISRLVADSFLLFFPARFSSKICEFVQSA